MPRGFKLTKRSVTTLIISALLSISAFTVMLNGKWATATPANIAVPTNAGTIQEAINMANNDDTIRVAAGTYHENVIVNKTITLMGDGQNVTIIEAKEKWKPVVDIIINNVSLSGFTVQGGSSGINVFGYNASRISDNKIVSNNHEGISLVSSHNNIIFSNVISLNGFEGLFDGVYLENSSSNLIYDNIMTHNAYAGIDLLRANYTRISNNTITFHDIGIWPESSYGNTFDGNTVTNSITGVSIYRCYSNVFHHNNFINNSYQVETLDAVNSWNTTAQGNYWSNYKQRYPNAIELDSTGVWNTPYVIDATNKDNFPLMNPWNPPKDITPPITADNYDDLWHTENFYINLTAVDDLSGIKETYYIINGGQISNVSANGQPYITTESSNNMLEYWSMDKAGHSETHHVLVNIKLDRTAPSGSTQINNDDAYTTSQSVQLNLSATDFISGVAQMRFSDDNTTWRPWEPYSTSKAWNLTAGDGAKTVYVIYMDNAGLNSQTYYDAIILDTAPPVVLILSPNMGAEIKSQSVAINWNGTDTGSGIDHYELTLDANLPKNAGTEQTYTFSGLNDGGHTVIVRAFDRIGQTNETSVSFVVNTSPLGGVGYFEEATLIVVVAVVIGITLYVLKLRKKRQ